MTLRSWAKSAPRHLEGAATARDRPRGPERRGGASTAAWALPAVGALALGALVLACRGGIPGVPVADDYDSLHSLRFERPLDWLGTMGSLWYWRPLSRQAYFSFLSPLFFSAPWVIGLFHAALFAGLYAAAARIARRAFDPWSAAAIAAFPLLAEPSRALLVWPTGAQPLIAMACIALALHEAAARRLPRALVAMAAALLAHEQALLVVPLVPLVARSNRRGILATLGVAGAWMLGRGLALGHGADVPGPGSLAATLAAAPGVLRASLEAQLGLGELDGALRMGIALSLAACVAMAVSVVLVRREARARLASRAPLLLGGAAWFALSIAPLACAAELWTPRHTALPGLGLGLALVGAIACASPRLAVAFTAVRLVALLLAPTAPPVVTATLPERTRPLSFLHVTRMQRTVDSARRALRAAHPVLPHGARIGWWSLPHQTAIGFAGAAALHTWYDDATLEWKFWDRFALERPVPDAVLGFDVDVADPARLMQPAAIAALEHGLAIGEAGDLAGADHALVTALEAQRPSINAFTVEIVRLRARLAFRVGAVARADSLNQADRAIAGESASYYGLAALLAVQAGRLNEAQVSARRALALRADDAEAREALAAMGIAATPDLAEF